MPQELNALIPVAIAAALLAVYLVYSGLRRQKRRRAAIDAAFGQPPASPRSPRTWDKDYWAGLSGSVPADRQVDDITWNDLSMDDVYAQLNTCQSTLGQAHLYAALRQLADGDTLQTRAALRQAFAGDGAARLDAQVLLDRMGRGRGAGFTTLLFAPNLAKLPFLPAPVYYLCALLPLLTLPTLFMGPAAICFPAAVCLNTVLYYKARDKVRVHLEALGYFSLLLTVSQKLTRRLHELLPDWCRQVDACRERLRPLRGAGAGLAQPAAGGDADVVAEYLSSITLLPLLAYHRAVRALQNRQPDLLRLCALVGEAELAIAAASFCESQPLWCTPTFDTAPAVQCQNLYHPLLDQPVPNSARFGRGVLFTGSNASGKSTFIKAVAVNAILAQTLGVCTAERFCLPRARVITSMAVADNILAGESYFIAELNSLRRVVEQAGSGPCLCFVDEILKGTNTVERIAASASVLQSLAHAPGCLCFVATHDMELTAMLEGLFDNRHFSEQVTKAGVTFDYLLKDGPARTRNAILLLDTLGYPDEITRQARQTVAAFEEAGRWPRLT